MYLKEFQSPHALLYGVYAHGHQDRETGIYQIKIMYIDMLKCFVIVNITFKWITSSLRRFSFHRGWSFTDFLIIPNIVFELMYAFEDFRLIYIQIIYIQKYVLQIRDFFQNQHKTQRF